MIGEVIRLTLAEWYKLRRRWLLWILLAVSVLISQAFAWGLNTAYHVNEETFGALIPPYEYRSEDGIIELTCADVAQGQVEEKLAPLSEAERELIAESLQEWADHLRGLHHAGGDSAGVHPTLRHHGHQ